jgi:hypothetical protein
MLYEFNKPKAEGRPSPEVNVIRVALGLFKSGKLGFFTSGDGCSLPYT